MSYSAGVPTPATQVNGKDRATRPHVGEVHEKQFVEAPAPEELGRKGGDIVGRRHDEDRALPLLEPRRERPE